MTDRERERILQKIEDVKEEIFEYTLEKDNRVIANAFDEIADYVRNMWTHEENDSFLSANDTILEYDPEDDDRK